MFDSRIFALGFVVLLAACGGSGGDTTPSSDEPIDPSNPATQPPVQGTEPPPDENGRLPRVDIRGLDQLYPYRSDSPYADILKECALATDDAEACTLQQLPFITQATADFSREDIMDRLLVSHDWMGERFETLLNDAPGIMIPLFGAITSISIGSDVRPSNYNTTRGAIRLDPAHFWLTTQEKANISVQEDFRSDFGADLQFLNVNSVRLNGNRVSSSATLTDYNERTLQQVKLPAYRLWFHELAHAVDYLPSSSVPTLDSTLTPGRALYKNRQHYLSPKLYLDLPLYSNVLYGLGQVSFRGEPASDLQKSYTAYDAGAEMANDGAMMFYAYSTEREDLATLFADTMLKLSFNADYYISYTEKPDNLDDYDCDELVVGWGVKNRLADPLVSPRARWVLEQVYGSSASLDQFFSANLGQAVPMTPGVDWCTNVAPVQASSGEIAARSRSAGEDELRYLLYEREVSRRNIGH